MKGWVTKKLSEVCEKITDGTHQTPTYFDDGIVFLSSRNVTSGKIDWENVKYVDDIQHGVMQRRVSPRLNDILLAKNGTTGVAAIVDRDVPFDIYVSLALLRPLTAIRPTFLLHFINSPSAKRQFTKRLKGIGVPNLHLEEIRDVEIPVPPLAEQQRIVGVLDEAFEGLATARAHAEKNLQNARALFESHLQSVFTQRGPGWVEKRLEQIGKTQTGSTPKTSDQSNYGDFISFVKPGDFNTDGTLDCDKLGLSESGAEGARLVPAGSVLMVCIGATIGKCGFCDQDVTTNQQVNALTPSDGSSNRFLYYQMLTETFQRKVIHASGRATLPIINKSKWSALSLWLPPKVADQKKIAGELDALSAETQRLASLYEQKLAALEALKKSLLHQAFSGQL